MPELFTTLHEDVDDISSHATRQADGQCLDRRRAGGAVAIERDLATSRVARNRRSPATSATWPRWDSPWIEGMHETVVSFQLPVSSSKGGAATPTGFVLNPSTLLRVHPEQRRGMNWPLVSYYRPTVS